MRKKFPPALVLLAIVAAATAAACNADDDDSGDATPTAAVTRAATRAATVAATAGGEATPSGDIRGVLLQGVSAVQEAITETGGQLVQENVIYADVTDDGVEEAIVPISSGGTLGNVGFLVLTPADSGVAQLLELFPPQSGVVVAVESGDVIMTQPIYAQGDAECCPSMLRRTVFSWNGAALAIAGVTTLPAAVTPAP